MNTVMPLNCVRCGITFIVRPEEYINGMGIICTYCREKETKMSASLNRILIGKIRKLRNLTCRRGRALVLHGPEGEILYDLLEIIVNDYSGTCIGQGRLFIDTSPIYTAYELSTQRNTYHGYIS